MNATRTMQCPEFNCPRRNVCASAIPHGENDTCKSGCLLLGESKERRRCVQIIASAKVEKK